MSGLGAEFAIAPAKDILLERLQVASRTVISDELAAAMAATTGWRVFVEPLSGRMVAELRAAVYARTLDRQTVTLGVDTPTSPWQAFKERRFDRNPIGRWWLRRWPVRHDHFESSHTFTVRETYPDATFVLPPEFGAAHLVTELVSESSTS
jgi:hypothetical protein